MWQLWKINSNSSFLTYQIALLEVLWKNTWGLRALWILSKAPGKEPLGLAGTAKGKSLRFRQGKQMENHDVTCSEVQVQCPAFQRNKKINSVEDLLME